MSIDAAARAVSVVLMVVTASGGAAEPEFVFWSSVLRWSRDCGCNAASSCEASHGVLVADVVANMVVVVAVAVVELLS